MSRTIEAIMRHMAPPSSRANNPRNGTEKLEKEVTVKKRWRYMWPEAQFVRTMAPFHSDVRVAYNGTEVDGKSVLDLMMLAPPEGSMVRIRADGAQSASSCAVTCKTWRLQGHPDTVFGKVRTMFSIMARARKL